MHKLIACVFLSLLAVAASIKPDAEKGACVKSVANFCHATEQKISDCNAQYSGFHHVHSDLQQFVVTQIEQSFQFLTMATKFGNYKSNRPGFEKLYRGLADKSWEESIELMKYITSRGYDVNLKITPYQYSNNTKSLTEISTYPEISELKSLSMALEMNKFLAEKAHDIHHNAASHSKDKPHDAEVMSFLENTYVHKHADTIRTLTGHVNDLHKITQTRGVDANLATFMFDEFLLKA
ncbi:ferritin heavy chain isoform X2 [Nilaparvata lugens]|uniref:Ferritin n=1 Tax=Nilaparvata lugens TaxID=108931 RepID=Q9U0S3_NILLU